MKQVTTKITRAIKRNCFGIMEDASTIDFLQEAAGKVTDNKAKCEIMYNFNSSALTREKLNISKILVVEMFNAL